jgi:hypothetical protein
MACVSLVMHPMQFSWEQVKPKLSEPESSVHGLVCSLLPEAASAALAFDTWVGQIDHGDHPHNIIFGYDPMGSKKPAYCILHAASSRYLVLAAS